MMTEVETKPLLRSARLLSRALLLTLGVVVGTAIALLIWLVVDGQALGQLLAGSVGYGGDPLRDWQVYALVTLVWAQLVIWGAVVWRGNRIFTAITAGALEAAGEAARSAARLLWIMLIWGILAHMLGSVIATWHFPAGERALSITLGSAQISTLVAALLATFTAHAFVLGAALWQDHQEVI